MEWLDEVPIMAMGVTIGTLRHIADGIYTMEIGLVEPTKVATMSFAVPCQCGYVQEMSRCESHGELLYFERLP